MSRPKWINWAIAAGAGALALTLLLPTSNRPAPEPSAMPDAPHEEHANKQRLKVQDVKATDLLTRMDAKQHLSLMLEKSATMNEAEFGRYVQDLQRTHDHIRSIDVLDSKGTTRKHFAKESDKGSKIEQQKLEHSFNLAKKAVMKRQSFESSSFPLGKEKYFVMGLSSKDGNKAVIALFSQSVLNAVEQHQRKNLRMIPYPREGKFKIESVHPDTLNEVTVKTGHDNANASHFYENEIVIRFRQDPGERDMRIIKSDLRTQSARKLGYTYVFRSEHMNYEQLHSYFERKWNPLYMEPHYMYLTNEAAPEQTDTDVTIPNDILFTDYQWNLPAIETNRGWNITKGKEDVIVAVVDTGVDLNHPDLKGKLLEGYNVVDPKSKPLDDVGHGTHVAGIIGAIVNNSEGVAGMSWYNKVLPVKVLDNSGSGTTYAVAEGIIWAADHGAKVINMSLGNYADAQFLHDAIKYAFDRDIVLIAATGNDNTERPGYPAAYPEVFAVSATDPDMNKASYSNYGDYVDVMAPGTSIASTYPNNQYAALSGTSMASPHVAALAGLIRSLNPDLTNTEVMDLMRQSVIDLGDPGHDKYYGYGQVDVYKALQSASSNSAPLQFWPQHVRQQMDNTMKKYNK
ncbi:S8 family peptidase [Paenibacillus sp. ACRRY]|uniref:S8 family peptidase n=1 Tax=Paenibacillus sp. ACRRY TaxID=2918208 RepID=UPI001EF3DC09|nr:S8 family peptidase [Paenibacillus sp. ACRRY]MCG7383240.1 S8 family peptidase [Paenibacillus sp. ACRRY]